jgi:hypothetical protein
LGAIGLGTVVGFAVFGVLGLLVALAAVPIVVRRRRRRGATPAVSVRVDAPVRARP